MPIELKITLIVAISIVVITRCVYMYCMSWKWNRMIETYLDYKSGFQSKAQTMYLAKACYNIKRKPWIWLDLSFWDDAQYCYNSKNNARLWFEITDYWHQNRK